MLRNGFWKKALIIQSLFFYVLGYGQNIYIDKPASGTALQDTQQFEVSITDAEATRVDFYLNGKLIQARKSPPWHFSVSWNTRYKNEVRFLAHFSDGETVAISKSFSEISVDVATSLEVVQLFPFMEHPGATVELRSRGKKISPERFVPAKGSYPLHLILVMDVSGSMKYSLSALSPAVHELVAFAYAQGWSLRIVLFDRVPRLLANADLPTDLVGLYQDQNLSVVYDALATACEIFPVGPRRVVLLLSDGYDDGSQHDADSVGRYLKKTGAALIWLSPATLQIPALNRLTDLSGGFTKFVEPAESWGELPQLMDTQYYLLAPDAVPPVMLRASRGRVFYPKWSN